MARNKRGGYKTTTSIWMWFGVGILILLLLVWLTIADLAGDTDVAACINYVGNLLPATGIAAGL